MCGGSAKKPKMTPIEAAPVAAPIIAPREADDTARVAGDEERRRRRAAFGQSDTILTSGLGDTRPAVSSGKQLLGQ